MAFISASVGAGGTNKAEDVKVVQWLLNQCEIGYHFMSSLLPGNVDINGVMNASTQIAIDDWAQFCDRKGLLANRMPVYRGIKLEPDSDYYKRLIFGVVLKSSPKVFVNDDDNYQDPRVKQAIDGRITFEQFKFIVEQAKGKVLTKLGREMQQKAKNPKVRAFLDVIAFTEGTDFDIDGKQTGYEIMMGGTPQKPRIAPNLYNHPGGVASGRYQTVPDTWREAQTALGLYDFTPESQEIFAVWALDKKRQGLLDDVIDDRFPDAVEKGSWEWASFPNRAESGGDVENNPTSRYTYSTGPRKGQKQRALKLSELYKVYKDSLKFYE